MSPPESMGPLIGALLAEGVEVGWRWIGLPFAVLAVLMGGHTGRKLLHSSKNTGTYDAFNTMAVIGRH